MQSFECANPSSVVCINIWNKNSLVFWIPDVYFRLWSHSGSLTMHLKICGEQISWSRVIFRVFNTRPSQNLRLFLVSKEDSWNINVFSSPTITLQLILLQHLHSPIQMRQSNWLILSSLSFSFDGFPFSKSSRSDEGRDEMFWLKFYDSKSHIPSDYLCAMGYDMML